MGQGLLRREAARLQGSEVGLGFRRKEIGSDQRQM